MADRASCWGKILEGWTISEWPFGNFLFYVKHEVFQGNSGREFSRKSHPSCFPTGLPPCSRPGSQRRISALPPEAQHPSLLRLPDRGRRDSRPREERGVCQSFEPAFGGIDAVLRLGKRIKAWNRSVYDPDREGQRSGHCGMIRPDRPVVRDESGFRPREVSRIILGKGAIHGLF